jgi:hypothetical protein
MNFHLSTTHASKPPMNTNTKERKRREASISPDPFCLLSPVTYVFVGSGITTPRWRRREWREEAPQEEERLGD